MKVLGTRQRVWPPIKWMKPALNTNKFFHTWNKRQEKVQKSLASIPMPTIYYMLPVLDLATYKMLLLPVTILSNLTVSERSIGNGEPNNWKFNSVNNIIYIYCAKLLANCILVNNTFFTTTVHLLSIRCNE